MKKHPPPLIISAVALLVVSLAAPLQADILYMANTDYSSPFGANYIQKFTTNPFGTERFANLSGVGSPFGMAFDGAANLYVAMEFDRSPDSGTVWRFTPEGVASLYLSGLSQPSGLAFDRAGNLFVADYGTIKKFTPAGVGSVFATGVGGGLAFDSADNLYAVGNGGAILKFTPDGNSSIFVSGGLNSAAGMAFDRAGNLYVVDFIDRAVLRFTPGGVSSVFAGSGLVNPVGAAFDSAGNLYVGDVDGIKEFTPGGAGSVFASPPYANGYPSYLAFTDDAGVPLPLANQVPEPTTWTLLGLGVAAWLGFRRFRENTQA